MVGEVILSKEQFLANKKRYFGEILNGAVFIYPTDTIYGLGCDATNAASVKRIREIKKRDAKAFSVIAPSKKWIIDNCEVPRRDILDKLPGQYTLILSGFKRGAIAQAVGKDTIGVRIPKHWISDVVNELGVPIVTTSVNITGEPYSADIAELKRFAVDFIIYEGELMGRPSTIVDGVSGEERQR